MTWLGLLGLLIWATLPVRVTPLTGEPYSAELLGVSDGRLQLRVDGEERLVATEELSRVKRQTLGDIVGPKSSAGLTDGSRLQIESVSIEGDQATLSLKDQPSFTLPLKRLAWVRFRAPSPEVNDAWLGMLGEAQANDRLVIRRDGAVIDQVAGVIKSADPTKVEFDLGGDSIPAPVNRLEGLIIGGTTVASDRGSAVVDSYGSVWAVKSLLSGNSPDTFQFELGDGQRRSIDLQQLDELRFADNSLALAKTEPVERTYEPLIASRVDAQLLSAWLGVRVIEDAHLVLRGGSSVTYRLDPDYETLTARIAPDPSVSSGTGALVQILLDDAVVWKETVLPADATRGIEIPLNGSRRVTFKVDFGTGEARGDAGDVIRFLQPRLVQ
jgi:hypothetical protein